MYVGVRQAQCGQGQKVSESFPLLRSKLWDNVTTGPHCAEFDFAQILIAQTQIEGQCVESLKQHIETSYRERLY